MPKWLADDRWSSQATFLQVARLDDQHLSDATDASAWMSADEHGRFLSITAPRRKTQYLAGHWLVRELAARHFDGQVLDWVLEAGNGALTLRTPLHQGSVHASISHSGDRVAVAVSTAPVGVDIESGTKQRDYMAIARHMFSPLEVDAIESLPISARTLRFHQFWTLKESLAKQHGEGLRFAVSRTHAAIIDDALTVRDGLTRMRTWHGTEYVMALAWDTVGDPETLGIDPSTGVQTWRDVSVD